MSGTDIRTRYCSRCLTTFPADAERCPNLGCRAGRPAVGWGELLEAGQLIDRTYRVHKMLAIGGAGVTYLGAEVGADGASEVGPKVAIKVLYQQRDQGPYLRRLATEAQILQGLAHPHIVECRGFVHRTGHSPYLVTRFEEGASLLDHLRRVGTLSIPVAAGIGRQVCWALDVAHRQGVVHRDLKPENVLLVRPTGVEEVPEVRVADFGIAKVYGGVGDRLTRVGAFVGTPQYAAPEQFEGLSPEPATDVYAVGALLYFCLTAEPIADFMAELDPDSQRDHLLAHLPAKLRDDVRPTELRKAMEDTLAVAMAVDPGDRCDILQLEQRLASLADRIDPGHVRLPPAEVPRASRPPPVPPVTSQTMTADEDTGDAGPPVAAAHAARAAIPDSPRSSDTLERVAASFPAAGDALRLPPATVTRDRVAAGPPATRFGCMALAGAASLAGVGIAGLAAWLTMYPTPTTLTSSEGDPRRAQDWMQVAGALGERGILAERACRSPPYLAVEVVVEADGSLREARLLNYPNETTRACIEQQLSARRFPRRGQGPVRVAVTLPR